MHLYISIFGLNIPGYGLMIAAGILLANLIVACMLKKNGHNLDDLLLLEGYIFLGYFIGSKLLFFITEFNNIQWNRFFEWDYLNGLLSGGYVFYGGLIGALFTLFLAQKIHKVNALDYLQNYIFVLPMAHGFGRVGCFFAGCCYGIPYDGPGAVVFPSNSFAPAGVPLFPIQIVEAGILIVLSLILLFVQLKFRSKRSLELYLIMYGVVRFSLEFLRNDFRGELLGLSTSQFISILFVVGAIVSIVVRNKKDAVKAKDKVNDEEKDAVNDKLAVDDNVEE